MAAKGKNGMLTEADYYDGHDILSVNAMWNFILGARGLGKTYWALRFVIRKYINNGEQFIYLRRTEEEVKKVRTKLFDDMKTVFPAYAFRVEGMDLQICRNPKASKKEIVWENMGAIMALSTSGGLKSIPYPHVNWILFEEIFPNKGGQGYLPNETEQFQELYSTIDRWHDRVRLIALSNAVSLSNPYFAIYGLEVENQRTTVRKYANGYIAVEMADYKGFSSKVKETRFGQFISNQEYAKYAMDNQFKDAGDNMLRPLSRSDDSYSFTIQSEMGDFRIWSHQDMVSMESYYTLSAKHPKNERWRTTMATNVTEDMPLISKRDDILKRLTAAYRGGRLFFESATMKSMFINMFGSMM
jgi:hypothetical protein